MSPEEHAEALALYTDLRVTDTFQEEFKETGLNLSLDDRLGYGQVESKGAGMSQEQGWIGVDLDGTLAYYDGWKGLYHIGEPIPDMAQRVLAWLKQGKRVKIVTARANDHTAIHCIYLWLEKWGCPILEVTDRKDFDMIELWDDRAVCVVPNTGKPCCSGGIMSKDFSGFSAAAVTCCTKSYAEALQAILELDPAETVEGYNEWGEALCLGYAKEIARAALVGDPLPEFNIPAPE